MFITEAISIHGHSGNIMSSHMLIELLTGILA